ncbi:hypothetical protein RRG08_026699 [Elysia crispata]|uniref:Uncharacterized protein n=1 Tax=Elysia crispata TaxID=231223 RepID=A0AAE0XVC0_9GAST|nr:hypothetical protein RRG08_026699 [Elysia crispata]
MGALCQTKKFLVLKIIIVTPPQASGCEELLLTKRLESHEEFDAMHVVREKRPSYSFTDLAYTEHPTENDHRTVSPIWPTLSILQKTTPSYSFTDLAYTEHPTENDHRTVSPIWPTLSILQKTTIVQFHRSGLH